MSIPRCLVCRLVEGRAQRPSSNRDGGTVKPRQFEVRWQGELPATAERVWEAFTRETAAWMWEISYEPWVGGAERGLTSDGGTVTVWDPPRQFETIAEGNGGFNQLAYMLTPRGPATYLSYVHRGTIRDDYERELDACEQHTAFYYHSLGQYLRHFDGRKAVHVTAEAPPSSANGGFAAMRRDLGVPANVSVGDRVELTPSGLDAIAGTVDFATDAFLGIRTDDGLYRFYGRDRWGWPVAIGHHLFGADVDESAGDGAWQQWLTRIFEAQAVA
jgi:hypothetical protein